MTSDPGRPDISVVVPGLNEGPNLQILLPRLAAVLGELGVVSEVLVVTDARDEEARRACQSPGCRVLSGAPVRRPPDRLPARRPTSPMDGDSHNPVPCATLAQRAARRS
jgi:hypothetical protein